MKPSESFVELERVFKKWNPDETEKSSIRRKFPDLFECLYEKKMDYEKLLYHKKFEGNTKKLSRELNKLKEEIVKNRATKKIEAKYKILSETEALIELDLFEKARKNLEQIWSTPNEIEYYLKWQILELETKISTPLEDIIGYKYNYLGSIQSIAKVGINITDEARQEDIQYIDESRIAGIIDYFRNIDKVKMLLEKIQDAKRNSWNFSIDESIDEIRNFEFNKNHFEIKAFFENSFALISKILSNPKLIEDNSENIDAAFKNMNDMISQIKTGSINFGPNILSVFFINESKRLELALLSLPKNNENFNEIEIHPNFFFNSIGIKEELLVYDIVIDILLFDGFEHDLGKEHITKLIASFQRLQNFLDGRQDLIHSVETKTGLMCLYVLFVRCLRAKGKKQLNLESVFSDIIFKEKMTETRYKNELENIEFYKELISKKRTVLIPKPKANNLIQLACLKLHENLPV
jgi:hypothetical protein